ncbi:MAG TPA: hypothetical protein VGH04_07115 [Gemmatimonadaceae bacterium]
MPSTVTLRCFVGIATAIVLAGTRLQAQTSRDDSPLHTGSWIVGGTGALDHQDNRTNISLNPSALGFVLPRFAVGGAAVLGKTWTNGGNSSVWGIGPTARLFVADPSDHVLPFLSASVLPEWLDQVFDQRITTLDGSVGATYLLSPRGGLTGEIYVTHFDDRVTLSGTSAGSSSVTHYGLRFGFTVFVH